MSEEEVRPKETHVVPQQRSPVRLRLLSQELHTQNAPEQTPADSQDCGRRGGGGGSGGDGRGGLMTLSMTQSGVELACAVSFTSRPAFRPTSFLPATRVT